jgi:flavin-dependent dehydrogenase
MYYSLYFKRFASMRHSDIRKVDVAIIGGGPAGLSTGLNLVRLDPNWSDRLVVLEKERHPRHKLCAGGITCFGLDQLYSLGLTLGVTCVPVKNARFHYGDQSVSVQGDPVFVVTRRSEFDAWLAQCAQVMGVNLIENSPVTQLERYGERIRVITPRKTYLARAIVGADGSKGIVRGWLGARERPPRVARVLEAVTPAVGFKRLFEKQEARFDFSYLHSRLQGYFWFFPALVHGQPSLNTGVYDARVDGTGPKASLKRIMDEGLQEVNLDLNEVRVEGHPIHWFSPWNRISEKRVILAGDSAGTDPLLGEGISISLAYGAVAARNLARAFRENDFSFKTYKRSVLFSPVGRYLLPRWFIASLMARLQGSDLFLHALWNVGKIFAHCYHPHSHLPETFPLPAFVVKQMTESVGD